MELYQLEFPNGKKYIGITTATAKVRLKRHCNKSVMQNACQRAIHKYGVDNVVLTVLATTESWELLCLAEMEAIEKFNTFNSKKGYNMTIGGEGRQIVCIYGDERVARDREYRKLWNAANKEKIALRKVNRDKMLARKKSYSQVAKARYQANNSEAIANRANDKANKEQIKEQIKAQIKANRTKAKANKEQVRIQIKANRTEAKANKEQMRIQIKTNRTEAKVNKEKMKAQEKIKKAKAKRAKARYQVNKKQNQVRILSYREASKKLIQEKDTTRNQQTTTQQQQAA